MSDAGMPMPAASALMPRPSYGYILESVDLGYDVVLA
jgi:hypothetical protein